MDLIGRRDWTLVAVLIWAVSWPAFWYTSKALVDPAAVGLMVAALCCLYRRRWLVPGLVVFVLAIWAKETALVLVPIALARELLDPRSPVRYLRAAAWVAAGVVGYLTAGLLVGGHSITFAPWIPASVPSALRIVSMNLGSVGGLAQFVFTATPALLGLVLWWHGRRSGRPILDDRDGVPLAVGIVVATVLSCWSFVSALWDGRTVWMSLPLGALLISSWGAARRPAWSWRRLVRPVLGIGAALFGVLVVWVVLGGLVNRQVTSASTPALVDIQPRVASIDHVVEPRGVTRFSGSGDGTITVDATGPTLVRYESTEPIRIGSGAEATPNAGMEPVSAATSGTVLVDADEATDVAVLTDGEWTATVLPVSRALFWEGLSTLTGSGPQVLVFPGGLVNSDNVDLQADGPVTLAPVGACRLGECPALPVSGDGTVTIPAGTELLVVDTEGGWKLVPERLTPAADALVLEGTRQG